MPKRIARTLIQNARKEKKRTMEDLGRKIKRALETHERFLKMQNWRNN